MKKSTKTADVAGMSDDAVQKKTGKSWSEWCKILDKAGAKDMTHKAIAEWLYEHHGDMGGWWCQMVTVGYERARDKRTKNQAVDGYQVSVSRVLDVPVSRAYASWTDESARAKWYPRAKYTVTTASKDKSLRILWDDEKSRVNVSFYPKGKDRAQVTVEHRKLASASSAERMRGFWTERMDRLSKTVAASTGKKAKKRSVVKGTKSA